MEMNSWLFDVNWELLDFEIKFTTNLITCVMFYFNYGREQWRWVNLFIMLIKLWYNLMLNVTKISWWPSSSRFQNLCVKLRLEFIMSFDLVWEGKCREKIYKHRFRRNIIDVYKLLNYALSLSKKFRLSH